MHAERTQREDIVHFLNACFTCTGQREFYEESRLQRVSIAFLHDYIRVNYRSLYVRSLAAGINHFNQSQIILNLLATGGDALPGEGALIAAALKSLPPQRAYKTLRELRRRKINNRRTRAIVAEWSRDGAPLASLGTQLGKPRVPTPAPKALHRMAKRELRGQDNRLRLLPLHLALEGLLALHFGGPDMKWEYFSRRVIAHGLSPRTESTVPGWLLEGFDDALRVFELHEGQVGVLVFVADALASAFVAPHPDDYRKLHATLIEDFFGELIWQHAVLGEPLATALATLDAEKIGSIEALRAGVASLRAQWADFSRTCAAGLFDAPLTTQKIYQAGPFTLERFIGDLNLAQENHIGERILGPDGSLQYLKTFRLSASQTRRAYLLRRFAECDWRLDLLAAQLQTSEAELLTRFENANLAWLFHQHVLDAARAARKKLGRQ